MSDHRRNENSPLRKRYRSTKMAAARPRLQMAAHSNDNITIDQKPINVRGQQAYVVTSTGQMVLPSAGHVPGMLRRPINTGLQTGSAAPSTGQYIAVQRHPMGRDGQYLMSMPIPPVQVKQEVGVESVETIRVPAFSPIVCTYDDITLNQSELLSQLGRLLVSQYRPIINASMFRLVVAQGTKAVHVDIDPSTFPDFMIQLLIRMMGCNTLPFTLEVKDAPLDRNAGLRKAINVQENEVDKWVSVIANRLRTAVKLDSGMFDTKLNVRFTLRLGFLAIEVEPIDTSKRSAELQVKPMEPKVAVEEQGKERGQCSQSVQTNIQICPNEASTALDSSTQNPRDVLAENLKSFAETNATLLSGYEAAHLSKMAVLEPLISVVNSSMVQVSKMAIVTANRLESKSVNIQTDEMSLYETSGRGKKMTLLERAITILVNKLQNMMVLAMTSVARLELKNQGMPMSQGNSFSLRQRSSDVMVKKETPEPFDFFGSDVPMIAKRKEGSSLYGRKQDNKENRREKYMKRMLPVQKIKEEPQSFPEVNASKFGLSRRPINQGLLKAGQRDAGGRFNSLPPQQREGRGILTLTGAKGRAEAAEEVFRSLPETDALHREMRKLIDDADVELEHVRRSYTNLEYDPFLSDEIGENNLLNKEDTVGIGKMFDIKQKNVEILIENDDFQKLFDPAATLICDDIDEFLK